MNPLLSSYINLITQFGNEAFHMIRNVNIQLWNQAVEAIENNKPQRTFEFSSMM